MRLSHCADASINRLRTSVGASRLPTRTYSGSGGQTQKLSKVRERDEIIFAFGDLMDATSAGRADAGTAAAAKPKNCLRFIVPLPPHRAPAWRFVLAERRDCSGKRTTFPASCLLFFERELLYLNRSKLCYSRRLSINWPDRWELRIPIAVATKTRVPYQLNCNFKFMSGWPPMLEVRWSALILPKVFGLRKSTVVVGGLQA